MSAKGDRRGAQARFRRKFLDPRHLPLIDVGGRRAIEWLRVVDVIDRDRLSILGQDLFAEVDLGIQEGHLDQEIATGRARQVGIAEEREPPVTSRQRRVGHQPELLRKDRRRSPGGRRVVSPDIAHHLRGRRRGDPGPEQRFGIRSNRQGTTLVQVSEAIPKRLRRAPDPRLDAEDVEVGRGAGIQTQLALDGRRREVRILVVQAAHRREGRATPDRAPAFGPRARGAGPGDRRCARARRTPAADKRPSGRGCAAHRRRHRRRSSEATGRTPAPRRPGSAGDRAAVP